MFKLKNNKNKKINKIFFKILEFEIEKNKKIYLNFLKENSDNITKENTKLKASNDENIFFKYLKSLFVTNFND